MTLAGMLVAAGYDREDRGAAVVVRDSEGTVVAAARGHARPGVPFTTRTVSYTGSASKQMVSVCVAQLIIEGRLDLEATVGQWLPELPPWAHRVRIRHLVHHTSGLPGDGELRRHIAATGQVRWDTPAVLNMSFDEIAKQRLFEPLAMSDSRFCDHRAGVPTEAAAGHSSDLHGDRWPAPLSIGDGGAWSTAEDLHRWNEALLPGGAIGARARTLVHTPGTLDDGQPIDYAWGVRISRPRGILTQSHGGNWPGGWTSKLIRLPDLGITVAALSNDEDVARLVGLTDLVIAHYSGSATSGARIAEH